MQYENGWSNVTQRVQHCLICTERDEKVRNRDLAFTGGKFVLSLWTTFDSSKSLLCVFIKQTELN